MPEFNLSLYVLQLRRPRKIPDIRLDIHNFRKTLNSRHAPLKLLGKFYDPAYRGEQRRNIQQIGYIISRRNLAINHKNGTRNNDDDIHHAVKYARGGLKGRHIFVRFCFNTEKVSVSPFKFFVFKRFVRKGFHDADSEQAVFHAGIQFSAALTLLFEGSPHLFAHRRRNQQHQRNHGEHNQRQPDIYVQKNDKGRRNFDSRNEKLLRTVMRELCDVK